MGPNSFSEKKFGICSHRVNKAKRELNSECSENASGGTTWKLSNFRTYFVCGCECGIFGCYELAHFLYWDLGSSKRTYQNIEALACDYSRLKTWSLCFYRCTHSVSSSTTNWDTKPRNDDAFSERVIKGKTYELLSYQWSFLIMPNWTNYLPLIFL